MISCEATGPPVMVWDWPANVVTSVPADRFCTAPSATSTTAPTTAMGSRIRKHPRTRSTQKFPTRSVRDRAKPRTRATATAIPTAADAKFCTASPAIWARCPIVDSPEYDCQFVLVTNEAAVLNAWSAGTPGNPRLSGRFGCKRSSAYSPSTDDRGEREQGTGVHGPGLVALGVDAHDPVDASLDAGVVVAGVDAGHVRPRAGGSTAPAPR